MNLQELQRRNIKFQEAAYGITNLMPEKNLLESVSVIVRSSKKIDLIFPQLLSAKTEIRFNTVIEKLEDEMDEVIIGLDKMAELNKKWNEKSLNDFVKFGYDLLSIYSNGCDKIIEQRIVKEV